MSTWHPSRVSTVLLALLTCTLWTACSEQSDTDTKGEPTPAVIPIELPESTRSALADRASEALGAGYGGSPGAGPIDLGELPDELGAALVAGTGDAGLIGARLDESVLDRTPPEVRSGDLQFFAIGTRIPESRGLGAPTAPTFSNASGSASAYGLAPGSSSQSASNPPDLGNPRLTEGVFRLLDLLDSVGMDTETLREAAGRARFHEEGEFPGGLPEGVEGATYLWKNDGGFQLNGFVLWLLIWWDGYHHVVLSQDHSLHLRAGDFTDDGRLVPSSVVALRELARIVAAETDCGAASPEAILRGLTDALEGAFALEQARTVGLRPSTADVLTYHGGVRDVIARGGVDCLRALGLPFAGSMEIDAPDEVPVGTKIEVTGTLAWPDGTPAAGQYVVLFIESLHEVVTTDESGRASHTFPAGDAPGVVEAGASALGQSARKGIRIVAGESGACCLPDGSCVVGFPDDCAAADGLYVGTNVGCDPDPCGDSGACCDENGTCTLQTLDDCVQSGHLFLGTHAPCVPDPCPPNGACCLPDGSCTLLEPAECVARDGVFQGEGTLCDTEPCSFGACCFDDGSCRQATEPGCLNLDGVWQGPGTACELVACARPGACCAPDGSCVVALLADCDGAFQGDGTSCEPNPCPAPGACCAPDGSCVVALLVDCDGAFQGDGTSCEPNPCPQPPTGACCWGDGTRCTIRTEAACTQELAGTYLGDGTNCFGEPCVEDEAGACCLEDGRCLFLGPADCAQAGGVHQGAAVPCSEEACPDPATGACCFETGNCQIRTQPGCAEDGGAYLGDEAPCDPNPCAGACCFPSGGCQILTESDCEPQGGDYLGDGTNCDPNPCHPAGACCLVTGECELLREAECLQASGEFLGMETACDPHPCSAPGACCLPDGECRPLVEGFCVQLGGAYLGDGTGCDPDPCTQTGACCFPTGSCLVLSEEECQHSDGVFEGTVPDCDPNPCEAVGACCFPDGSCTVVDLSFCEGSLDGIYQGDGTNCSQGCAAGACCLPDGSCVHLSPEACAERDGWFLGRECEVSSCTQIGACCRPDGSCELTNSPEGCSRAGGDYAGDGTVCEPSPCGFVGACCLESGDCRISDSFQCSVYNGEYLGAGTVCVPSPCELPVLGACCLPNGSCVLTRAADCDGTFLGDRTACNPYPCGSAGPREIRTDIGDNEGVTVVRRARGRSTGFGSGSGRGSGSGPGDLFVAGNQGVAAYDLESGTFRGLATAIPQAMLGTVFLDAPVSLPGTDVESWLFMFGLQGTQQRPWSPTGGWLSTETSGSPVFDASAYDDRSDGGGMVVCQTSAQSITFVEFTEDGGLLGAETLHAIGNYASGPPVSAFARTPPGGAPGGEALFVTLGTPGQLWHPSRGTGQTPQLVGTVGDNPARIRALGEVAVVTNFTSGTLTVVHWPYGGAPSITATVDVGQGPVGVSLTQLPSGNVLAASTGFLDGSVTMTVLSPEAQVISSQTEVAPLGCFNPGHAAFSEGGPLELVVSCAASANVFVLPVADPE